MMMCYNTTSGSITWCILALFERYFGNAYTNKKMFLPCQDWTFCKTRNLNCVPCCYLKPLNICDRRHLWGTGCTPGVPLASRPARTILIIVHLNRLTKIRFLLTTI